jgi:acyl dehydratase
MATGAGRPPRAPTIAPGIAGVEIGPVRATVDARWLMAYAAGAGAYHPRFFDTARAGGPVAHPLFPVCYEWPLMLDLRARVVGEAAAPFGVHASHRLRVHRLPHDGDQLAITARVTAVEPRPAGTLVLVRLVARDARGALVSETDYGSLYRGVGLEGTAARSAPSAGPHPPPPRWRWREAIEVPYHQAHVYTECARIWNPIHTDVAAARAAGLPGPILHGTATLALAVSRLLERDLEGDAAAVRGIEARFTGMVPLPSTITVRAADRQPAELTFDVTAAADRPVISQGALRL